MTRTPSFMHNAVLLLLGGTCFITAGAQAAEDGSRITQVKVYPGSATIERTARIAAGARSLTFRCLPASLDTQSLQVQPDASVRVGEITSRVQDRDLDADCATPLDEQVRNAQDQLALAKAETESLELSQSFLKTVASTAPSTPQSGPGTPGSATISLTTDALRRQSLDVLQRLHLAKRKQEAAELALKSLTSERDRIAGPNARVTTVTVTLAAERDADLRLSYQVRGPSWSPSYRATLDSSTGLVRIDRLALVAQNTGEDWKGVPLTLSTGQPTRNTSGRLPRAWTVDVAEPERERMSTATPMGAMQPPPAPAPAMARVASAEVASAPEMPRFDVQATDNAYATEFTVPQRITLPSGGQRVTLSLGAQEARAQLLSRTAPQVEAAAYLVAQLPTLPGVWPTASVALYRDNAYAGQGTLNNNDGELSRTGLSFGRDERMVVTVEPLQKTSGSAGLTGSSTERRMQHAFRIDNRHQRPMALQVLDAAPVARDERIRVESQYDPAPADKEWNRQPGLILWSETLSPGASLRVTASHTLRYPKDVQVQENQ